MRCMMCGKEDDEQHFRWIAIASPDGEQEEQCLCTDCQKLFKPYTLHFQVIGGQSYSDVNRPPFWHNEVPLSTEYFCNKDKDVDMDHLPLQDFPLIEDFEILLERMFTKYEDGEEEASEISVWLFSPSRGYLAWIREYRTQQDLCRPDFIVPHGDFAAPYSDIDQAWEILIAEDQQFVYIMQWNWELNEGIHTWFKVDKKRYYSEWERAVQRCRHLATEEPQQLDGGEQA